MTQEQGAALLRQLLWLLATALLTWLGTDVVPFLRDLGGAVPAILAALVATLVSVLTPLERRYGVGARRPLARGGIIPGNGRR